MPAKQFSSSQTAPDGSQYVTITDGIGNLLPNPGNSGLSNLNVNQVTLGTTATLIAAARSGRNAITVTNLGTVDVFIGNSNVTAGNGTLLPGAKGSSLTIPAGVALYGIVATGTQAVSFLETY